MEVHHHPHVEKKRFKEYFLEFLMIFLAVTMGFFAENIRETHNAKQNAKEYARLLVDDVATDIKELDRTEYVLKRIIQSGDSLSKLITSNDIHKIPGGKLYYYEYWSGWQWRVTSRDATLKALENSGSLRYIGNGSLIKKILDYEESLKIITLLENNFADEKAENRKLVQKIFDQRYFTELDNIKAAARDSSSQSHMVDSKLLNQFLNKNYPLIYYDKNEMMELSNRALNSSRDYRTLLKTVDFARQKANEEINALKKEYNLQ